MEETQKKPWYLSTIFIAILFALWQLIVPPIIGVVLIILQWRDSRKQSEAMQFRADERIRIAQEDATRTVKQMQDVNESLGFKRYEDVTARVSSVREELDALQKQASDLQTAVDNTEKALAEKKEQLVETSDEVMVQEFGLYEPQFDFANSLDYKEELANVRAKQKELIKAGKAVTGSTSWTVNDSAAKGRKMVSDTQKLLLRAFNSECDELISKVRYTNFDTYLDKISKSAETISKLGTMMHISITREYLNCKIKELRLAFEFQLKKNQEKEDQKLARAEMREAAKLQREIEAQRLKFEKEQTHYETAYEKICAQLEAAPDNADLLKKKEELAAHIEEVEKALRDVDYREANQKAGYVYVISNIGAFGKDVYKIGMTRRLEPQDRVDELGDASVPFNFDVHAMIFADDAPALEAALHKAFENKKLNMVNQRREFFHVTLDEIKEVVRQNFDKTVEFIDVPNAEQYRVSEKMRAELSASGTK